MTEIEKIHANQIELWKKTVEVQQHFNVIGLQIRNFAVVILSAFLVLAGYALRDGTQAVIFGVKMHASAAIVWSALFPLLAFYLMDRFWYHRLLRGSVAAGRAQEVLLRGLYYEINLESQITESSAISTKLGSIRSNLKMDLFYGLLALSLVVLGFGLASSPTRESVPTDRAAKHVEERSIGITAAAPQGQKAEATAGSLPSPKTDVDSSSKPGGEAVKQQAK